MKADIQIEQRDRKPVLVLDVNSVCKVNDLILSMIDAGFSVNHEPKHMAQEYEGSFLCGEECDIVIRCKNDVAARKCEWGTE